MKEFNTKKSKETTQCISSIILITRKPRQQVDIQNKRLSMFEITSNAAWLFFVGYFYFIGSANTYCDCIRFTISQVTILINTNLSITGATKIFRPMGEVRKNIGRLFFIYNL